MRFPSALVEGRLVRRYKRFFADIDLGDGRVVVAHCANPGSMKTCLTEGARAWVSRSSNPKRKLRWTWEMTEVDGAMIYVNPVAANRLVAEAIKQSRIPELGGYSVLEREVPYGKASRVDVRLRGGGPDCYVEIKNVTMSIGAGRSAFPDSVTERGTKHLRELMAIRRKGHRAVAFFCASRTDASSVEPADGIDPVYGKMLREAANAGVELVSYRVRLDTETVELSDRVPVVLP